MSGYRPRDAMREGFPWVPVFWFCGFLAVAGILSLILVFQPWVHKINMNSIQNQAQENAAAASASASVNENSYNYNKGYLDILNSAWQTMHSDMSALGQEPAYAQPDTKAAVLSDGQQVCYNYAQINQKIIAVSPGIISWVKANCDGTDVSMTSSLRK